MKKIALATLLAATTMVATAQVSISGKVAQFADSTKTGASDHNKRPTAELQPRLTLHPASKRKF